MQSLVSDPRGLAKQVRVPAGRKSEVNPADIALQGRGWSSCQYRNSVAATDAGSGDTTDSLRLTGGDNEGFRAGINLEREELREVGRDRTETFSRPKRTELTEGHIVRVRREL